MGLVFGYNDIDLLDNDFLNNYVKSGENFIGLCLIVYGCVVDENGCGVLNILVEVW